MLTKNLPGSAEWTDPDDAPKLTPELLAEAEVFEADQFIRRQRGRPLSEFRKEKINVRLDPGVLERLRASGPGWQSKINRRLAMMTGADRDLWDLLERLITDFEKEIADHEKIMSLIENGTMRSHINDRDTTAESLTRSRQAIVSFRNGIEAMHRTQSELFQKSAAVNATPDPLRD